MGVLIFNLHMILSYINREDVDFDNVDSFTPTQEWELIQTNNVAEYQTRLIILGGFFFLFRLKKIKNEKYIIIKYLNKNKFFFLPKNNKIIKNCQNV
jgi:hypothetical protein